MTNPVQMVVDDNPDSLRTLEESLRRRYEREYVIIGEITPAPTGADLPDGRATAHRPVAAEARVHYALAAGQAGKLPLKRVHGG